MKSLDYRRTIGLLDFFYGFFFGIAVFAASLTFIVISHLFSAILLSTFVFAFFMFLMVLVKYLKSRLEISQNLLDIQIETRLFQEKILEVLSKGGNPKGLESRGTLENFENSLDSKSSLENPSPISHF